MGLSPKVWGVFLLKKLFIGDKATFLGEVILNGGPN